MKLVKMYAGHAYVLDKDCHRLEVWSIAKNQKVFDFRSKASLSIFPMQFCCSPLIITAGLRVLNIWSPDIIGLTRLSTSPSSAGKDVAALISEGEVIRLEDVSAGFQVRDFIFKHHVQIMVNKKSNET